MPEYLGRGRRHPEGCPRQLPRLRKVGRLRHRATVEWRPVRQRLSADLRDHLALVLDAHSAVRRDLANADRVEVPLLEDALDLSLAPTLDDKEHALLGFGKHDLVRRHACFALRDQ